MACFHPMPAYARPSDTNPYKKEIVFVDSNELPTYSRNGKLYYQKLFVPCGQCIGCRLEYSRQWALRCVLEAKQHQNNYFVTLTYNDENLPSVENCILDEESGEVCAEFISHPLVPKDLTDFMKLLRRELEYHYNWTGVRFYACGEYGSKTQRPHFHIILFNMPVLEDLELYTINYAHDRLYNSKFLDKIWKKGYIVVGNVSFDSCAYVARYMMKKHKGKDAYFYADNGLVPEFSRCSRRGGIGSGFFQSNRQTIYRFDEVLITDKDGKVRRLRPPKYYDRLYDLDDPAFIADLKARRQASAEESLKKKLKRTSLSCSNYLTLMEGNKIASIERLSRHL